MCWNIVAVVVEEDKGIMRNNNNDDEVMIMWNTYLFVCLFVCLLDDLFQDITGVDMVSNHFFDFFCFGKIKSCLVVITF